MTMEKFNDMLEIDILRNSSQKNLGILMGVLNLGVQKDTQTPCWLRPCLMLLVTNWLFQNDAKELKND